MHTSGWNTSAVSYIENSCSLLTSSSYERILSVICGSGKTPNQRRAVRIIQWMLVTRRSLKKYELECAVMLNETNDVTAPQLNDNFLSHCDPLLDVDDGPTGAVKFCHFTAVESV